MNLDAWDFVFFVVVLAQSTCVAYLKSPGSKAFAMTLPIPLTFGVLALGQPINATHVGGLLTGALYIFLIYLLHARLRVPIVLTIIIGISVYCIVGTCAGRLLPRTPAAFWGMIGTSKQSAGLVKAARISADNYLPIIAEGDAARLHDDVPDHRHHRGLRGPPFSVDRVPAVHSVHCRRYEHAGDGADPRSSRHTRCGNRRRLAAVLSGDVRRLSRLLHVAICGRTGAC
jgi:hypothetical protein